QRRRFIQGTTAAACSLAIAPKLLRASSIEKELHVAVVGVNVGYDFMEFFLDR
ncbi:MAG: twin-arginine translocation signal domain-containing protein, partial [Pirellula sp.]